MVGMKLSTKLMCKEKRCLEIDKSFRKTIKLPSLFHAIKHIVDSETFAKFMALYIIGGNNENINNNIIDNNWWCTWLALLPLCWLS